LQAALAGAMSASLLDPSTGDGHGDVQWVFTGDESAFQFLQAGENLVLHYDVEVSDGLSSAVQDVAITINGVNDAPVITQTAGATAATAIQVAENTASPFLTVTATDAESQQLTYSIGANPDGSYDNGFFSIDPSTGALRFTSAPDFEFTDPGNDDLYKVRVTATDTQGGATNRDYFVKVTDLPEGTLMDFEGSQVSQDYVEDGMLARGFNGANGLAGASHIHWQDFAGGNSAIWGHSGGTDLIRFAKTNGTAFNFDEIDVLVNSGTAGFVGSNGNAVTVTSTGHYTFGTTFDGVTFVDLVTFGNHGAQSYSSNQTTVDNLLWI
jgi:VCBS repeat-containing protein